MLRFVVVSVDLTVVVVMSFLLLVVFGAGKMVEAGVRQVDVSGSRDQDRDARPGGVMRVRSSRCYFFRGMVA